MVLHRRIITNQCNMSPLYRPGQPRVRVSCWYRKRGGIKQEHKTENPLCAEMPEAAARGEATYLNNGGTCAAHS